MTNLALHPNTPSQRPPATAPLSAPTVDAVPGRTNVDHQTNDYQTKGLSRA